MNLLLYEELINTLEVFKLTQSLCDYMINQQATNMNVKRAISIAVT